MARWPRVSNLQYYHSVEVWPGGWPRVSNLLPLFIGVWPDGHVYLTYYHPLGVWPDGHVYLTYYQPPFPPISVFSSCVLCRTRVIGLAWMAYRLSPAQ